MLLPMAFMNCSNAAKVKFIIDQSLKQQNKFIQRKNLEEKKESLDFKIKILIFRK